MTFSVSPPLDYTKEYDTAIAMLELHQRTTIELDAQQALQFMRDDWSWGDAFLGTNMRYSDTAAKEFALKNG